MPTVRRDGPYSFIFFSTNGVEPPHIHVVRDRGICKFWLNPVALAKSRGFAKHELNEIRRRVIQHQHELLEAWNAYFGT
ncbi:MAG: DUF4160 domain-containing protein [Planctomycetia bacterium]|nr:DUF4160 domain-containing protein [Planctomycetia bacterium]